MVFAKLKTSKSQNIYAKNDTSRIYTELAWHGNKKDTEFKCSHSKSWDCKQMKGTQFIMASVSIHLFTADLRCYSWVSKPYSKRHSEKSHNTDIAEPVWAPDFIPIFTGTFGCLIQRRIRANKQKLQGFWPADASEDTPGIFAGLTEEVPL